MPNRYQSPFSTLKIRKTSASPATGARGGRAALPQESAKGRPSCPNCTVSNRGMGMQLIKTYVAGEYQKGNPTGGATKPWIQGAIKHPGAFTAKAKTAGQSVASYAQEKRGAPGILGKQARLAITLRGMR